MNVLERLLKVKDLDVRVSVGDRWLYWDDTGNQWVVLTRPMYKKTNTILYQGSYIDEAAAAITEGLMAEAL